MASILLTHPVHGAKIAISELEAEYDESNGWTRYDENAPVPANNLSIARRGRRPAPKEE
jgi:hypothetical protein